MEMVRGMILYDPYMAMVMLAMMLNMVGRWP
jgi:hypothetical protein